MGVCVASQKSFLIFRRPSSGPRGKSLVSQTRQRTSGSLALPHPILAPFVGPTGSPSEALQVEKLQLETSLRTTIGYSNSPVSPCTVYMNARVQTSCILLSSQILPYLLAACAVLLGLLQVVIVVLYSGVHSLLQLPLRLLHQGRVYHDFGSLCVFP